MLRVGWYGLHVPFVDRWRELAVLEAEWARPGFRLVVVYGRRRVGKTRLLLEWLRGRSGVYYVAAELGYQQLSMEFGEAVARQLGVPVSHRDIVEALEDLAARLGGERVAVVLDEFQYIVEADPTLPSRLQRSIDHVLGRSNLYLVLSGSAVSWFEKKLLAYRAPLHGRRTSQLKVRPMRLVEARGFWPKLDSVDALRAYSIVGGTPAYLAYTYNASSLRELLERVLSPGSPLLEEALSLLRQELREPRSYAALLKAIADGRTTPSEAAQVAGIDPRTVHRYVEVLEELDILEARRPLGRRRGVRLRIVDEYFRFYFRHIQPLLSIIETGGHEDAVEAILPRIDEHASETFEKWIEAHLPELHRSGILPIRPVEHGGWWHRGYEIDLVVREPGKTAFIEAKWSSLTLREAASILKRLERLAPKTGLMSATNYYIVFARSVEGHSEPVIRLDEARIAVQYTGAMKLVEKQHQAHISKAETGIGE